MDEFSPTYTQAVLNQIAQGDDQAIMKLYRHYRPALFAYIRHLVTVDEAAEDILHDTFMVIYKKPLAYNGQCTFFTWLCSIAKNKVADWWRATQRQQKKDIKMEELDTNLADTIADLSWTVLECYEGDELNKVMQGCLDKLPAIQREAAYWTYYHDLPVKEVALIAECPENTIKTRLLHARNKIRDCLERVYADIEPRRFQ
jgi:RNA polymerase sigma-70 factor, ECF subfamily